MTGIMVVGHGHFATGISSAAQLIVGKQRNYAAVDFPEGDTKTELEAHIREALDTMRDMEQILIFCDILNGSPFHTVMMESIKDHRLRVYYGTNLAMLIEILMDRELGNQEEGLQARLLECGREQIGAFVPEDMKAVEEDAWD